MNSIQSAVPSGWHFGNIQISSYYRSSDRQLIHLGWFEFNVFSPYIYASREDPIVYGRRLLLPVPIYAEDTISQLSDYLLDVYLTSPPRSNFVCVRFSLYDSSGHEFEVYMKLDIVDEDDQFFVYEVCDPKINLRRENTIDDPQRLNFGQMIRAALQDIQNYLIPRI